MFHTIKRLLNIKGLILEFMLFSCSFLCKNIRENSVISNIPFSMTKHFENLLKKIYATKCTCLSFGKLNAAFI